MPKGECEHTSTKFLVDDGTVVVATEATVSLITDVSMVQQMKRHFPFLDSNSLSVDFDGQVPREVLYSMVVLPGGVAMFQAFGEHMAKESSVSCDTVFASATVGVAVSLGAKLAQAEGRVSECT